jgi:hypothetical protein
MRALRQKVNGTLWQFTSEEGDLATALLLDEAAPLLYLRYALVIMGLEEHVFPAFLLDDWGNEIKGLKLYAWLRENGNAFPRAEIFGFGLDGSEVQHFAREFELYVRWPCYAYADRAAPLATGLPLARILVPDNEAVAPEALPRPPAPALPLRRADVSWWRVNRRRLAADGYTPALWPGGAAPAAPG